MDQFDTWEKDRITEFVTKVNAMQYNQPTSSVDFASILAQSGVGFPAFTTGIDDLTFADATETGELRADVV